MNDKRVVMNTLDKNERIKNFDEVSLGLTDNQALSEASRCLNCKNPSCVKGCPVGINIPKFIEKIKENDLDSALKIIMENNNLPGICGRVCPQEKQCEKYCIKGLRGDAIFIGALERYVADNASIKLDNKIKENGLKVAIIGSGPAGLTCAYNLRKMGYQVTIYEALHEAGGVLRYGIPEFRLPKRIVDKEIENLKYLGVKIITNVLVGKSITIDDLRCEFDAIFIATGAGLPKFINIPGIFAKDVFSANEILTRINLMNSYKANAKTPIMNAKTALVIGGGNVAMDVARSLKRLGIDVSIMYQRRESELSARLEEVNHAKDEGIKFMMLKSPKEILVNDDFSVKGLKYVSNQILDELDDTNRPKFKNIDGSDEVIDVEMIVMAIGTNINNIAFKNTSINVLNSGIIDTVNTKTNLANVFAGGDVATGAATVISACAMGIEAALKINECLGDKNE